MIITNDMAYTITADYSGSGMAGFSVGDHRKSEWVKHYFELRADGDALYEGYAIGSGPRGFSPEQGAVIVAGWNRRAWITGGALASDLVWGCVTCGRYQIK